jgi:hypothetical protein
MVNFFSVLLLKFCWITSKRKLPTFTLRYLSGEVPHNLGWPVPKCGCKKKEDFRITKTLMAMYYFFFLGYLQRNRKVLGSLRL